MSKRHRRGRAAAHGEEEDPLEASARLIARARSITVFTGAGISVESGIPDFRSEGGLWQRFDPSVYCDYDVFRDRPEMFWTMVTSLYGDVHARLGGTREELRRGELKKPKPNAGEHERWAMAPALSHLQQRGERVRPRSHPADSVFCETRPSFRRSPGVGGAGGRVGQEGDGRHAEHRWAARDGRRGREHAGDRAPRDGGDLHLRKVPR